MNQRVSKQDVLTRINRELQKKNLELVECQHLCKACAALGDYYLMDSKSNSLIETHVDLKTIARDEGCLADSEDLEV